MSYMDHSHNFRGRQYRPVQQVKIVDRRTSWAGSYWKVEVNGQLYHCANEKGKMVRIAFKPRGQNRGYHWYGTVRDAAGKTVWNERVGKSTGPLAMLHDAGVIRWQFEKDCELCRVHYGDAGACDEGKPVNSPHRTAENRA